MNEEPNELTTARSILARVTDEDGEGVSVVNLVEAFIDLVDLTERLVAEAKIHDEDLGRVAAWQKNMRDRIDACYALADGWERGGGVDGAYAEALRTALGTGD